ncbi:MAG TPA: hypothetical protein VLB82_12680 [Thermodesulfobacteriota bacterium]|nr:hypothetical protein [Thermodesulfobacteriota bacterium]
MIRLTLGKRNNVEKRSMTSQVEYWAKIGNIAEDNPDLPFSNIRAFLLFRELAKGSIE